jgi:uncharacterized RDD family membrane protein YckC
VVVTDSPQAAGSDTLLFVIMLIGVAMWFAYEVPAVANSGQTIGKRLLGLRVMRWRARADGLRPAPGGAGTRWRCPPCSGAVDCGFVIQFVDNLYVAIDRPLRQALHDKTALTVVVKVRHDEVAAPEGRTT